MDLDDACNTGLVLGLGGYEQSRGSCRGSISSSSTDQYMIKSNKLVQGSAMEEQLPSLTLCLGAAEARSSSPPHSAVSSFSNTGNGEAGGSFVLTTTTTTTTTSHPVKRERETGSEEGGAGEEMLERHYSRGSDEDEEGSGRKKLRLTKEQSALLEESFKEHSTLNPKQKQALAKQLSLRPRQVEVWFQNRRARTKLKQTEVDCEFLRRCCESLTDENRRLQKELQELKALKFSSSPHNNFYMHLPAATLTMCPSCERIGAGAAAAVVAGDGVTTTATKSPFNHVHHVGVPPRSHFYNPFSTTHPSAAC